MKRFLLALVAVTAGVALSCRAGGTRPADAPASEGRPATARPEDYRAASAERGAASRPAEPGRHPERARETAPDAEAERAERPKPPVVANRTALVVTFETAVGSDKSRAEDLVVGKLAEPVLSGDRAVIPAGSEVRGHVLVAQRSARSRGWPASPCPSTGSR